MTFQGPNRIYPTKHYNSPNVIVPRLSIEEGIRDSTIADSKKQLGKNCKYNL